MLASLTSVVDTYLALDEGLVRTDLVKNEVVSIDGNLNRAVSARLSGKASFVKILDTTRNVERYYIILGRSKIEITTDMDMVPKPLSVVRGDSIRLTNEESRYCVIKFSDKRACSVWLAALGDVIAKLMCVEVMYRSEPSNELACRNLQQCIHTCSLLTTPNKDYFQRIKVLHSIREKLVRVMHTLRHSPSEVCVRDVKLLKDAFLRYHELQIDPSVRRLMEQLSSDEYRAEDLQPILKDIESATDDSTGKRTALAQAIDPTASFGDVSLTSAVAVRASPVLAECELGSPSFSMGVGLEAPAPAGDHSPALGSGASATGQRKTSPGCLTPVSPHTSRTGSTGTMTASRSGGAQSRSGLKRSTAHKFTSPAPITSTGKSRARTSPADTSLLRSVTFTTSATPFPAPASAATADSGAHQAIVGAEESAPAVSVDAALPVRLIPSADEMKHEAMKHATPKTGDIAAALAAQGKENVVNHVTVETPQRPQPPSADEVMKNHAAPNTPVPGPDVGPVGSKSGPRGDLSPLRFSGPGQQGSALALSPRRSALLASTTSSQRRVGSIATVFRVPPSPLPPSVTGTALPFQQPVPTAPSARLPVPSVSVDPLKAPQTELPASEGPNSFELSHIALSTMSSEMKCVAPTTDAPATKLEREAPITPAPAGEEGKASPLRADPAATIPRAEKGRADTVIGLSRQPMVVVLLGVVALLLSCLLGAYLSALSLTVAPTTVTPVQVAAPSIDSALPPAADGNSVPATPGALMAEAPFSSPVPLPAVQNGGAELHVRFMGDTRERLHHLEDRAAVARSVAPRESHTRGMIKARGGALRRLLSLPWRAAQALLRSVVRGWQHYKHLFE